MVAWQQRTLEILLSEYMFFSVAKQRPTCDYNSSELRRLECIVHVHSKHPLPSKISKKNQCPDLTNFVSFSRKIYNYLNFSQEGSVIFVRRIYCVERLMLKYFQSCLGTWLLPWQRNVPLLPY